jgi:tripartite-type tricarboxylate transporter receptor subunit TctC
MHHRMKAVAVAFVAAMAWTGQTSAQDWPTRPMTMVAPAAAGSSTDLMARILAPRLSEVLGQQVIVENVGGAGGMTGTARVARAAPDGYQISLGFAGTHAINQTLSKQPLYNAATDFAPVALIATLPIVLIARPDLPASNLQEFIAYAKANQAKMQYGSAGVGSTVHLACALLNATIGVNVTHVPYRGGGPAMQDLVAGRIDYQCVASTIAVSQIQSKAVKPIAILSRERSPSLPDMPTAHEQGLTNFEAGTWYALFLPKGTPAAIVSKLHDATVATMDTPTVQARLKEIGADLMPPQQRSPDYLAKFVATEIEKWAELIKAIGVKAE